MAQDLGLTMEQRRERNYDAKREMLRPPATPALPPPAKKDLPRPAQAGDKVLSKADTVDVPALGRKVSIAEGTTRNLGTADARKQFRRAVDRAVSGGRR